MSSPNQKAEGKGREGERTDAKEIRIGFCEFTTAILGIGAASGNGPFLA
jgi:hypothetical protein